jgi:hypothetical protein
MTKRMLSRREKAQRQAVMLERMAWMQAIALTALGVYCIGVLGL